MRIEFISGFAVIAPNPRASRDLYVTALGLPLKSDNGGEYYHSESIAGSKHFGVWPLDQAAQACFGTAQWPTEFTVPQACVEFEVQSHSAVESAAQELQSLGHSLLHAARTEPWGQTVARLLSPEGLVVGISYAPALHNSKS